MTFEFQNPVRKFKILKSPEKCEFCNKFWDTKFKETLGTNGAKDPLNIGYSTAGTKQRAPLLYFQTRDIVLCNCTFIISVGSAVRLFYLSLVLSFLSLLPSSFLSIKKKNKEKKLFILSSLESSGRGERERGRRLLEIEILEEKSFDDRSSITNLDLALVVRIFST